MPNQIAGVDVVIFSGLLSGTLAFASSIVATFVLYRNHKKQARLQSELQESRQQFDAKVRELNEKAGQELERYKIELAIKKAELESELRQREDFLSRQMQNLFLVVERSQTSTRSTLNCFRSMLHDSKVLDSREFLLVFNSAIVSFNAFSESMASLDNVVRPKDKRFLVRSRERLLEMLLGMRLEPERRLAQSDFLARVEMYEQTLRAIQSVFGAKYRRILQPRSMRESA